MGFVVGGSERRWGDRVPYRFGLSFDKHKSSKARVKAVVDLWNATSALPLVHDAAGEAVDYINFNAAVGTGGGNSAGVGRVGKGQNLTIDVTLTDDHLGDPAFLSFTPVLLHELGHAVGLIHEHQRSDRDERLITFAVPEWDGGKQANVRVEAHGIPVGPYDCSSLMHYLDIDPYLTTSPYGCGAMSNAVGLTDGDRAALGYLAGARFSVLNQSTLDVPWTHGSATEIGHHDYLLLYAKGPGNVRFMRVGDGGSSLDTWGDGKWFGGWDQVITLEVRGAPLLLVYDMGTGDVRIDRFVIDTGKKSLGSANVWDGGWGKQWTVVACGAGEHPRDHVLVYNAPTGRARLDAVNADPQPGKGTTNHWEETWRKGYDRVVPFRVGMKEWNVLLYDADTGAAEVRALRRSGSTRVKDYTWSPGWSTVVAYPQHSQYFFPTWRDHGTSAAARLVFYNRVSGETHFDLLSASTLQIDGRANWAPGWDLLVPHFRGHSGRFHLGNDGVLAFRMKDRLASFTSLS